MRWVLPGGAVLGGNQRGHGERAVACRPGAAVLESLKLRPPPSCWERLRSIVKAVLAFFSVKQLTTVKLVLEVLAVLVGLIGAILALFGWSRK